MNSRNKCRSGFTLTEIMIVVSLVGLLATIALPNFVRSRATAQTNVCINNLRKIDDAIQQWAMEEKKTSQAVVEFTDISAFLRHSVLCPAGGTSFADSYTITVVGSEPICQRVPTGHLLPQAGLDVAATATDSSGSQNPAGPGGPGNGNGYGIGNGNGNGYGIGNGNGTGP